MTTGVTEETYYNYADYCSFKNKFESYNSHLSEDVNIDETSIPAPIDENKKHTFTEQHKIIKTYLENSITNDLKNESKYCGYLNYWLNKGVSMTYNDKKKLFFNYFKTFIEKSFGKKKSNTCITKLEHMDDELLDKMVKLYDLYDYYENNHLSLSRAYGNSYVCGQFEGLVKDYNTVIDKYKEKGGDRLLNKLRDLICLIKHDKWLSKNDCKTKVFQLFSQKSNSLYDKSSCETLEPELLKLTDLMKKELSKDHETPSYGDRASDITTELDGHHRSEDNPDSAGAQGLNEDVSFPLDDASVVNTSRYIINTALPLLGASSFTFLLYKVTPAGTFVNKFFGKNKSAYRNIDNIKKNALGNYNYETEEIDTRNETMNISYNTLSYK
ncbi:VIR protein [Plasmodium vivax]|uniref:VIR protein n=1 Tax=Plasmodium vivax TaxID=5855 RepID=A0A1G4EBN0_PLAVI|nr:VIR protein [Plasmodium vivax]